MRNVHEIRQGRKEKQEKRKSSNLLVVRLDVGPLRAHGSQHSQQQQRPLHQRRHCACSAGVCVRAAMSPSLHESSLKKKN